MSETRIERDSMGELAVPADALYGAQTQRAVNNFAISGRGMPPRFIHAVLLIKKVAAEVNADLGLLPRDIASAIGASADDLFSDPNCTAHFPVDIFQTGSGTSTNMNANEVLATLAGRRLGSEISPNDHVNCSQSSNDVIPTAIHVSAAIALKEQLQPALSHLTATIRAKADESERFVKNGRTHLMDAMPLRMSQALNGWAAQIEAGSTRLEQLTSMLGNLAQGGTAVGTGINAHPDFAKHFTERLSEVTALSFRPAPSFFSHLASQDTAVALSGQLKSIAVSVMKISNDLRWMNSGPLAGLGEIELEALQPGSSIMPGKVNPVIPEAAAMVAAQVIGNDGAITIGGQSANFELNVMLPVIATNLLESIELLATTSTTLANKAIATFVVREDNLQAALARNPILVTALNPVIGYLKAAEIAKQAYAEGRPILDVAAECTELSREELQLLLDPVRLTRGGID